MIGFLGAGKMAAALAKGFVQANLAGATEIFASDPAEAARESFQEAVGARTTGFNPEVVRASSTLILAVKPNQAAELLKEIRPALQERHLLISIAAGLTLSQIESAAGDGIRVVRVMPNTPALIGCSASAFALGRFARAEDGARVRELFSAVGIALQLKEELLDAVTGLSGSGPAFVYLVIEALSDGGVAAGLPREIALQLAAQTVMGSARMVLETGMHPGALKDMVASPGGTTIEGLHELEKGALRGCLMNAVRAASEKSRRLGSAQK